MKTLKAASSGQSETASTAVDEPFTIPPQLVATLDLLTEHIAELTRDNEALRNTFLPHYRDAAAAGSAEPGHPRAADEAVKSSTSNGVDLEAVLQYVKELIRENEELGEMLAEAGRTDKSEWQIALDGAFLLGIGFAGPRRSR